MNARRNVGIILAVIAILVLIGMVAMWPQLIASWEQFQAKQSAVVETEGLKVVPISGAESRACGQMDCMIVAKYGDTKDNPALEVLSQAKIGSEIWLEVKGQKGNAWLPLGALRQAFDRSVNVTESALIGIPQGNASPEQGEMATPEPVATQPAATQEAVVVVEPEATEPAATSEPVKVDLESLGVNLDDDGQLCADQCSWDIGVNEYTDGTTAQVGFAWGESVSWGEESVSEPYNLVVLNPGWYEDLTVQNGGIYVYNFPEGVDQTSLGAVVDELAGQLFKGKPVSAPKLADLPEWDSARASISNSAQGPAGVGDGLEFPQLDGQEISCAPQQSPCNVDAKVGDNQIGILFGYQLELPSASLAGPAGEGSAANEPENRCDLVVLDKGLFDGLLVTDGRLEVYNVPAADPDGWSRNLVAERAEEQAKNYGCPTWEEISVWSPSGITGKYSLVWDKTDATASGPTK